MGSTWSAFAYGPHGELLYETDGTNTKSYVYLNGVPLARIDNNSQIYYYHDDHLGSPQAMTDATGTTVWAATYEPFGNATITTSTITNNLRFPGMYADSETGLYYNGARYYDPRIGRYVSSDPIGLAGGLNTYLYAKADPLRYIDPYGLAWQLIVGGGATVIAPFFGGGLNFNVGLNIDGWNSSIYIQDQANLGLGGGAFIGAGLNFSLSKADAPTTGFDSEKYLEADIGYLGGVGVSATGNSCGGADYSGAKGFKPGVGLGVGAFVGTTYTSTAVSPTIQSIIDTTESFLGK